MFELSREGQEFVKKELTRYETKMSAIIPSLFKVQEEKGWVPKEAIAYLSELMGLPAAAINEVFMFYTMFNKEPVGALHVQVCTNISCSMNGGRELTKAICKAYGIDEGGTSKDGKVTVTRVECLGSCGTAPMMQVNDRYLENLTAEKALKLLKEMEKEYGQRN